MTARKPVLTSKSRLRGRQLLHTRYNRRKLKSPFAESLLRRQKMRTAAATVCLASLIALTFLAGCHTETTATESQNAAEETDERLPVRVEPAERRTIATVVFGLGRCEPLPKRIATLTPAVEGRVAEILARYGEAVKRGQPIARLDPTIAQAALAEKVKTRDGLQASLRLLESLPRPEEQQNAKLAIEQAKVAVAKAQSTVDRLRPLRARNEISQEQMFEAQVALRQAELQQQTADAQLTVLMLKPRPEAIDEARAKIAAAEAAVDSARAQLDLHAIRSPIDGVLNSITCRLGQTVSAGTPVGDVVDCRDVDLVIWLRAEQSRQIHVGQTARVRPGGGADQGGETAALPAETMPGQVTFVGQTADPQTGNVPVRILIQGAQGKLAPGEVASANILLSEKSCLAVPAEAIQDLGEGPVINVVRGGKSVVLHASLGVRDKHWVEVEGTDLKPGDLVIVDRGYNLPEGTQVAVEEEKQAGGLHQKTPEAL